jgi:hypothetical protein
VHEHHTNHFDRNIVVITVAELKKKSSCDSRGRDGDVVVTTSSDGTDSVATER